MTTDSEIAENNAKLVGATGVITIQDKTFTISPLTEYLLHSVYKYINIEMRKIWFPIEEMKKVQALVPVEQQGKFVLDWMRYNRDPPWHLIYEVVYNVEVVQYFVYLLAHDADPSVKLEDIPDIEDTTTVLLDLQAACGMDFITQRLNLKVPALKAPVASKPS